MKFYTILLLLLVPIGVTASTWTINADHPSKEEIESVAKSNALVTPQYKKDSKNSVVPKHVKGRTVAIVLGRKNGLGSQDTKQINEMQNRIDYSIDEKAFANDFCPLFDNKNLDDVALDDVTAVVQKYLQMEDDADSELWAALENNISVTAFQQLDKEVSQYIDAHGFTDGAPSMNSMSASEERVMKYVLRSKHCLDSATTATNK